MNTNITILQMCCGNVIMSAVKYILTNMPGTISSCLHTEYWVLSVIHITQALLHSIYGVLIAANSPEKRLKDNNLDPYYGSTSRSGE